MFCAARFSLRSLAQMICALTARRFSSGFRRRWSSATAISAILLRYASTHCVHRLAFPINRRVVCEAAWRGRSVTHGWFFWIEIELFLCEAGPPVQEKSLQSFEHPIPWQLVRRVRHETGLNPRRTPSHPSNTVDHFADLHGIEARPTADRRALIIA
jgi:hypothetical protein